MKYHANTDDLVSSRVYVKLRGEVIGYWTTIPSGECLYFSNTWYANPFRKSA